MNPAILAALIGVGGGFLQNLLFGGGGQGSQQSTQQTITETPSRTDPGYALLSPVVLQALLKNMQGYSGWGGGPNLGIGNMVGDVSGLIGQEWPRILEQFLSSSQASTPGTSPSSPLRTINRTQLGGG